MIEVQIHSFPIYVYPFLCQKATYGSDRQQARDIFAALSSIVWTV